MRSDELLPALGPREVIIRHSPLNVERGLDEILPRPPALDLLLGYAQGAVDGLRLVGAEDGAPVAHQNLRRAVSLDGGIENREVGGRVLDGGDRARQDRPRVVFEYADRVDLVRSGRQLVLRESMVYVADVHAPDLVPPFRLERHLLLLFGAFFRLFQAIELAV